MIGPGTCVRVYLACGVTDMRNYVATIIMRSRSSRPALFLAVPPTLTPHNYSTARKSIASSLSGGRNLPGLMPSGSRASSISSFSVGSARK